VLPVVLYSFFGLPFAGQTGPRGLDIGVVLLTSFAAYAVGQVMVYGFGIGVAMERGQKIDLLMRATPLPPGVYLAAKIVVAMLFGLLAALILFAYATVVGGVRLAPGLWASVIGRLLAGSLPLIALGFAIGFVAGPNAAPAVVTLNLPAAGLRLRPLPAARPAAGLRAARGRRTCRRITTRSWPGAPSAPVASGEHQHRVAGGYNRRAAVAGHPRLPPRIQAQVRLSLNVPSHRCADSAGVPCRALVPSRSSA